MTLKVGDVVRLRSGGPEMTVDHVSTDRRGIALAHCAWHDGRDMKYCALPCASFDVVKAAPPLMTNNLTGLEGMHMPESWRSQTGYYTKVARFRQRLVQNMPWA